MLQDALRGQSPSTCARALRVLPPHSPQRNPHAVTGVCRSPRCLSGGPSVERSEDGRHGGWGAGVIAIGVGVIFGVQALNAWSKADSECASGCPPGSTGLQDRVNGNIEGWVAAGALIGGGVLVAGAAVLWFTAPSGGSRASRSDRDRARLGPHAERNVLMQAVRARARFARTHGCLPFAALLALLGAPAAAHADEPSVSVAPAPVDSRLDPRERVGTTRISGVGATSLVLETVFLQSKQEPVRFYGPLLFDAAARSFFRANDPNTRLAVANTSWISGGSTSSTRS